MRICILPEAIEELKKLRDEKTLLKQKLEDVEGKIKAFENEWITIGKTLEFTYELPF